jgi:hypothetical protein
LDSLVTAFASEPFPEVYNGLNPRFVNGEFVFSAFEKEDSRHWLATKGQALLATMGYATTKSTAESLRDFSEMDREMQEFVAYNLSHEWKIATLAAAIATVNQNCKVFEIGPCFGISSVHYSHLIKDKDVSPTTPISSLIAIDFNRGFLRNAKQLQKICGEYVGDIRFVSGEGLAYLRKSLRSGDLVFSSVADSRVVEGILDLSSTRAFNFAVSYSKSNRDLVRKHRGKHIEDIINPSVYEVFPFLDKEYNSHVTGDLPRMGVLALKTK